MNVSFKACCILSLAVLALAGCNREAASDAATAPSAVTPPPPLPADEDITMHYACDRGVEVFVLRNDKVQARMPDGTIAKLSRIADSAPPVFTGAGLYFRVGEKGAFLSQGDGVEEVACLPE